MEMTNKYDFKEEIDPKQLKNAGRILREGGLVIFPTETVYGIGANALKKESVEAIFQAKGRANDNPLIVHIHNFEQLHMLTKDITEVEQQLIDAFFPGPFTLVLKKKDIVPDNVSANLDTVGIRMPENKIAHLLLESANVPVAAPSANLSSRPSGTNLDDIEEEFEGKVDLIIDGGSTSIGIESTVVRVIDEIPTILRPGKITPEDIRDVIGVVKLDHNLFQKAEGVVRSPGMKYKHYAPNSPCFLLYSNNENTLISLIQERVTPGTIVIGFQEHKDKIKCDQFYVHGSIDNYDEISHNIFTLLRKVDHEKPTQILIEGVKKEGIGIAIMNRLIRSSSYQYIEK